MVLKEVNMLELLKNCNFVNFIVCILVPLLTYFSYWLFITGIFGLVRMLRNKNWNKTFGTIIDAELRFKIFDRENRSIKIVPYKLYTYKVDNVEFQSSQIYASDSLYQNEFKSINQLPIIYKRDEKYFSGLINQEEKFKRIIGNRIKVYYNPKNPSKACLKTKFDWTIFLPILMGLIFGSLLTYFIYQIIKDLY